MSLQPPIYVVVLFTIDAAMIDLSPVSPKSAATSHSAPRSIPSSGTSSAADSLLTIIRPAAAVQSFDDSVAAWQDSSDDTYEAVDQLFASLDESDLLAEVGLLSAFV